VFVFVCAAFVVDFSVLIHVQFYEIFRSDGDVMGRAPQYEAKGGQTAHSTETA